MFIYFSGTDPYRIRQAVDDLVRETRTRHTAGVHVVTADCAEPDAGDTIERALKYPPFFGDITFVIVVNAASPVLADIVKRYPLSTMKDTVVVGVHDATRNGINAKAASTLAAAADRTTEFAPLSGAALARWVGGRCTELQGMIEPDAVRELIARVGPDAGALSLELEKLAAYAQGTPIGLLAVRTLTPARTETDEWGLSNAVASLQKRGVVSALWRSVHEGTPDQLIIGTLASGLRNLLIIKGLSADNTPSAGIAKRAGIHPFIVSKMLRGALAADGQRLKKAHIALASLDRDVKDGRRDAVDGLFDIALSL
jgi:DNA polymerase III delta subunit